MVVKPVAVGFRPLQRSMSYDRFALVVDLQHQPGGLDSRVTEQLAQHQNHIAHQVYRIVPHHHFPRSGRRVFDNGGFSGNHRRPGGYPVCFHLPLHDHALYCRRARGHPRQSERSGGWERADRGGVTMKVHASTVEGHEFRLERRGYEKAQVEAVLARVVETLREYEEQIAAYEARLTEAEASQEAVRRTFLAAQRTHDEMLAEAQADATKVRQDAERHRHEAEAAVTTASEEAEATRAAAETQAVDIQAKAEVQADAMVTEARRNADVITTDAQRKAEESIERARAEAWERLAQAQTDAERLEAEAADNARERQASADDSARETVAEAREQAEGVLTGAADEAGKMLQEATVRAERLVRGAEVEAARISDEATATATAAVEEARRRAEAMITAANDEHSELTAKLPRLRTAVADIERQLRALASSTLTETEVVDTLIDLAAEEAGAVTTPEGERSEPDGSGALPAERAPTAGIEAADWSEGGEPGDPGPLLAPPPPDQEKDDGRGLTRYQRRGGGLRRRLATQRRIRDR